MSALVVALDVPSAERAQAIVDELYDFDLVFKIGLESLLGYRERILRHCEERDVRVCIDAKLHDIPRTAGAAARQLVSPAVRMITAHATGGTEMLRAVVDAAGERAAEIGVTAPGIFAVTLLTSTAAEDAPVERVVELASLACDAGCAGVVCSAREVRSVKETFGEGLATLVPGIRPAGFAAADQRRVATPAQAIAAGADYVVVGRPVTEAADRRAAVASLLEEMALQPR